MRGPEILSTACLFMYTHARTRTQNADRVLILTRWGRELSIPLRTVTESRSSRA